LAHQQSLDMFFPDKIYTAKGRIVVESSGLVRLKTSLKLFKTLNIPPKGLCKAFIKGHETYVTYNTSGVSGSTYLRPFCHYSFRSWLQCCGFLKRLDVPH